jgi:hypothetical protein
MSNLAWLAGKLSRRRVERDTTQHLASLLQQPVLLSQQIARDLLLRLRDEPGPKVHLGTTTWGEPVVRATFLLARRLEQLEGRARQELLKRIVIIDFSSQQAVSPYNILSRWPYTERDFFVTSRLETLRELLPAGEKLSLRGATVLKNVLALLSEFELPLTYLNHVLESQTLRAKLLARSKNPELRGYFGRHFAQESKQTIGALRARMESLRSTQSKGSRAVRDQGGRGRYAATTEDDRCDRWERQAA